MKKWIRRLIQSVLVIGILLIVIFFTARFGWKLFGYSACSTPNSLQTKNVTVTEEQAVIYGSTIESAPAFVGYIYEIKDGSLFIGVKYNLLFGFLKRTGDFKISVDTDGQPIGQIYFKDDETQCLIWNREE